MKIIYYLTFLAISLCILPLNWLRERIKNGPSARLWLATDADLLAEAQKRGLAQKQAVVVESAKAPALSETTTQDAIEVVTTLGCVPEKKAREAVGLAEREFAKSGQQPKTQDLAILALKMV